MDASLGIALSQHYGLPGDWNERHPYVRFEDPGSGWGFGAFQNSEGDLSLMGGKTFRNGKWFGDVGLATGYDIAPIVPLLRGGYEPEPGRRFFVIPSANKDGSPGLVFGFEADLWSNR